MITLSKSTRTAASRDTLILLDSHSKLRNLDLERNDRQYLTEQLQADPQLAVCDVSGRLVMVHMISKAEPSVQMEKARRAGDAMAARLNTARRTEAQLISLQDSSAHTLALAEGVALGSYAFRKYKSDAKGAPTLEKLNIIANEVATAEVDEMSDICEATWTARDLVNEPVSFLNAVQLGAEIRTLAKTTGFKVEVMELARIRALGLSGLLAVNKGSVDPPTFSVLEWKPKNAVNKKPILLVGKGVVYDTGGLSLKPTANSMDQMKCDMAGAAAVACAIAVVASVFSPSSPRRTTRYLAHASWRLYQLMCPLAHLNANRSSVASGVVVVSSMVASPVVVSAFRRAVIYHRERREHKARYLPRHSRVWRHRKGLPARIAASGRWRCMRRRCRSCAPWATAPGKRPR